MISSEDLETTIYVLKTLAENPDELGDKSMKEVKRSVHELYRVMVEGSALGMFHIFIPLYFILWLVF